MIVKNKFTGDTIREFDISPGANLTDANLGGANLTDADLTHANLWEANLRDANLWEANFMHADLRSLRGIVWPHGWDTTTLIRCRACQCGETPEGHTDARVLLASRVGQLVFILHENNPYILTVSIYKAMGMQLWEGKKMTSAFERFSVVRERVKAWEECLVCEGRGDGSAHGVDGECGECIGEGGAWHEAVTRRGRGQYLIWQKCNSGLLPVYVNKDTILVKEHRLCKECNGEGRIAYDPAYHDPIPPDMEGVQDCSYCHRDADGNPTGAEPGTAEEWRVENV